MKKVHFVEIRVFDKENNDLKQILADFTDNVPENKGVLVEIIPATQEFPEEIKVATLRLEKSADDFLNKILGKVEISKDHVDEKANLYIRLDKKAYIQNKTLKLTELGDCIHIKANLAAYPAKKEKGIAILNSI